MSWVEFQVRLVVTFEKIFIRLLTFQIKAKIEVEKWSLVGVQISYQKKNGKNCLTLFLHIQTEPLFFLKFFNSNFFTKHTTQTKLFFQIFYQTLFFSSQLNLTQTQLKYFNSNWRTKRTLIIKINFNPKFSIEKNKN